MGVTIDDARAIAATLPRSHEALVRDQVRFRLGRMVYVAFYDGDTTVGSAFPSDERVRTNWACAEMPICAGASSATGVIRARCSGRPGPATRALGG